MKVLIKQARIICPHSGHHGKVQDILIENGIIKSIGSSIEAGNAQIIEHQNLHASIGWMDVFADFADPGQEARETIETGAAAAAAGGFTDIMLLPNTNPAVSGKGQVEYIIKKAIGLPVNLHPIGSVTQNAEGNALSEMYDMAQSGAIAFGDGKNPLQSPGILLKAMQYVMAIGKTIIQLPGDSSIAPHGLMNEGIVSTQLGLPGKPAIAEELMIARDIELLKYTGSRLHITGVSTKKGMELIDKAKQEGMNISYSVTAYHAYFCDEDLKEYDTNLKVNPALRTRQDMEAVRNAIVNGNADCLASHHIPQHWDNKTCEFEYAKNGMLGLQTMFGVVNGFGAGIDLLIEKLSVAPRKIFGLAIPELKEGSAACLTLFDPAAEYEFKKEMILSKSHNTAFIGKKMKGLVLGTINNGIIALNPL
ncbi:MAG: dihydroorotase [Ferruginibacter sp.]